MQPIDWLKVQRSLGSYYNGIHDGKPGPLTYSGLLAAVAGRTPDTFTVKAGILLSSVLPKYKIDSAVDPLVQFFANTSHETGDYTVFEENLNYSSPSRLVALWPGRFNLLTALAYIHNPQKLAEKVYGGRFGNPPGRAYDYRGGGWIQTTFYDNYADAQKVTGLPLLAHPELLHGPYTSIEPAAAYWYGCGCNELANSDTSGRTARIKVNGGTIGLDDVMARVKRIKTLFL